MFLEWINCVSSPDIAPIRGAIIRCGADTAMAWTFDSKVVFGVPIVDRKLKRHTSARQFLRNKVRVVGFAAEQAIEAMREQFGISAGYASPTPDGWDGVISDAGGPAMPRGQDGWQPMSMADGTWWRRTKFPKDIG